MAKFLRSSWVWIIIFSIFTAGAIFQSQSFIDHDISWLLHATKRFLNGGNYLSDFVEINPPMALYIHIPPLLLARFLHLEPIIAFRLFIFSIALLSTFICSRLLGKIIKPADSLIYNSFLITLMTAYIILPGWEFGQREQLAIMLIMPYLLLAAIRSIQQPVNTLFVILIGIMAGLGFAIKPHFMFAFGLVEIYLLFKMKSISCLFRPEPIIIVAIFISYIASIFIVTPEYLQLIPYIRDFFSLFLNLYSLLVLLIQLKVIFLFSVLLFYFCFRKEIMYRELSHILLLGAIGFFLTYIAEPLFLNYHTIPMFTIAMLLSILLFGSYVLHLYRHHWQKTGISIIDAETLLGIILIFFLIPGYILYYETHRMLAEKNNTVNFMKNIAHGKHVYLFSTIPILLYPVIDYAKIETSSRFEHFWTVPYLVHLSHSSKPSDKLLLKKQEDFLIQAVVEDLKKKEPDLIFIEPKVGWRIYENVTIDYLALFSRSTDFRAIWKNYRYLGHYEHVKIYKRIDT